MDCNGMITESSTECSIQDGLLVTRYFGSQEMTHADSVESAWSRVSIAVTAMDIAAIAAILWFIRRGKSPSRVYDCKESQGVITLRVYARPIWEVRLPDGDGEVIVTKL
jgi:hypothetical protein